ncbi:hypothetical protein ABZP36_010778 [Zizania latifolia]
MEASGEELLKKFRELEVGQAQLKQRCPSSSRPPTVVSVSPRCGKPPQPPSAWPARSIAGDAQSYSRL